MTTKEAMTVSIKPWYDVIKKYISVKDANIFNDFVNALINGCIERLDSHHWIPVSERLPEDGKEVLTWDNDEINIGSVIDKKWYDSFECSHLGEVTRWRELPSQPEGG